MKTKLLFLFLILITTGFSFSQNVKKTQYPFEITTYGFDKQTRVVKVTRAPKRIYVDGENNIDILYALGVEDTIAGIIYPGEEYLKKVKKTNPNVIVAERKSSKEFVILTNPDFIVAWYSLFTKSALDEVDYWHNKGIGTYVSLNSGARRVNGKKIANVDSEFQDILNLGKIFNRQEKAEAIVNAVKQEIERVQKYVTNKKPVGVAILEAEEKKYRVYGVDSLAGDMALKVGGTLQMGQEGNGSASAENIIKANPDVIIMVSYEFLGTPEAQIKKITKNPQFASLKAVKNKRVHAVDLRYVYASGIKTGEGLQMFAKAFYPELYK